MVGEERRGEERRGEEREEREDWVLVIGRVEIHFRKG